MKRSLSSVSPLPSKWTARPERLGTLHAFRPVHGAQECALLKLLFTGAYSSLVFHALPDYLTTSIIWAITFADNAFTELITATSIKNTQTSTLTATCSIQAGWKSKAAPALHELHPEVATHLPLDFQANHFASALIHENKRCLMPGVSSVKSWTQTALENSHCYAYTFCKGFFNQLHDYTVVCHCEVTKFTEEALFCPLSDLTGLSLLLL